MDLKKAREPRVWDLAGDSVVILLFFGALNLLTSNRIFDHTRQGNPSPGALARKQSNCFACYEPQDSPQVDQKNVPMSLESDC